MELNETQRRHLYEGLAHLERQLEGLEAILAAAAAPGRFPRYRDDVDPAARAQLAHGIAAARARIGAALTAWGFEPEPAAIGALQAFRSHLSLAEVGADDFAARSMRGYGDLAPDTAEALDRLAAELRAAVAAILPAAGASGAAAPAVSAEALADALGDATGDALETMAQTLADAVSAGRTNDELVLIAGDALAAAARACAAPSLGRPPESLPAFDIDRIRWRLGKPRFAFGRDALLQSFRKQLAPRRDDIRAALRAYAHRCRR